MLLCLFRTLPHKQACLITKVALSLGQPAINGMQADTDQPNHPVSRSLKLTVCGVWITHAQAWCADRPLILDTILLTLCLDGGGGEVSMCFSAVSRQRQDNSKMLMTSIILHRSLFGAAASCLFKACTEVGSIQTVQACQGRILIHGRIMQHESSHV